MLYTTIKYLHVISIFGFLLSHGASVQVAFALKREHDSNKIRTLLDLSRAPYLVMIGSLLASILFGVIAGFIGHWWRSGWIWVSIALLIVIFALMFYLGTNIFGAARNAAETALDPTGTNQELLAILEKSNPILLTIIGYGGFAIITLLMMFKPF
jgi:ABC-type uncharacterized transport system permease subunit